MESGSLPTEAAAPGGEVVEPARPATDRFRWALLIVLRGGVLFAAALLLLGLAIYFVNGTPRPLTSGAEAAQPVPGLASISAPNDPLAIISYGLFVLVLLPIARVVLSLFHFVRVRDRLYVFLTSAVLAVLLVGIIWGKAL